MTSDAPFAHGPKTSSRNVLDPLERSSEIMFGLIMALTFTCTVSVASSTRNDITTMLAAALACNVAWGLVDGAMYVLGELVMRERRHSLTNAIRSTTPTDARMMLIEALPEVAAAIAQPLAQTDRMVIINSGDGAGGASKLTADVTNIIAQVPATIEALTGIDLEQALKSLPGIGQKPGDGADEA